MQLDRAHPFYEGEVPVKVEQSTGTDGSNTEKLTIRVIPGIKKTPQGQRIGVMRIELTQDTDLFFLYTLEISEDEFHDLKKDQSLLVDFSGFPPKFVELLDICKDGTQTSSGGRFIAILDLSTTTPTFRIVEANHFKQVTHLALKFTPGTDASVKEYLASRLRACQQDVAQQHATMVSLNETLDNKQSTIEKLSTDKANLTSKLEKIESKLVAEHHDAMSKQKEEALKLLAQTQNASSEQARKQQELDDKRIQDLEQQLSQLQLQHRKVYEDKCAREAECSQLTLKLGSLEKFSNSGVVELDKLRESNRELQMAKFEMEKSLSECQITIASLRQQLQDKDLALSKSTSLAEQAQERRIAADEKIAHYKSNTAKLQRKLELSIAEINKGNALIERIQRDLKQAKDKLKMKSVVIRQQESTVEELQMHIKKLEDSEARLKDQVSTDKASIKELKQALEASKTKLEECNKILESNQNVITYLNKEINEAQMGSGRSTARLGYLGVDLDLDTAHDYMKPATYDHSLYRDALVRDSDYPSSTKSQLLFHGSGTGFPEATSQIVAENSSKISVS